MVNIKQEALQEQGRKAPKQQKHSAPKQETAVAPNQQEHSAPKQDTAVAIKQEPVTPAQTHKLARPTPSTTSPEASSKEAGGLGVKCFCRVWSWWLGLLVWLREWGESRSAQQLRLRAWGESRLGHQLRLSAWGESRLRHQLRLRAWGESRLVQQLLQHGASDLFDCGTPCKPSSGAEQLQKQAPAAEAAAAAQEPQIEGGGEEAEKLRLEAKKHHAKYMRFYRSLESQGLRGMRLLLCDCTCLFLNRSKGSSRDQPAGGEH